MSLMKSDRTKAPKSDRIAGYAITRARGSDGSKSSSQLTAAAWPVRPDPLPSQGGFGAPA